MNIPERNRLIVQEYVEDHKDIQELARCYGLSPRRIGQILDATGVERRERSSLDERKPISRLHSRIGLYLYDFRFTHGIEAIDAAEDLGWSKIKLGYVEKGFYALDLLDLQNLAAYTETSLSKLLGETHAER